MARLARIVAPGCPHHVTARGNRREPIFFEDGDQDIYRDLLAEASEGNPRTLNLLAQAAWLAAARLGKTSVETDHVHVALRQVPAATAKIASA